MRIWLFAVFILLAAMPSMAGAQEFARAEVTASVRVPDFMRIESSGVEDTTSAEGGRVRRVTLLISANRSWRLEVTALRSDITYVVSQSSGRAGSRQTIVVELAWRGARAPEPGEVTYSLVAR